MKKFVLTAAVAATATLALASCGGGNKEPETGRVVEDGKIGFILPGQEGEEIKNFRANWNALAKEYGLETVYENFKGMDPGYYVQMADSLISKGVDAIICNFEMDGKEAVIEKAVDAEVYVGYSGSSVSEATFEEWENNPYFLGQVAPLMNEEIEQTYNMTKYYVEEYFGANKKALPAGTEDLLAVWPVDFHGLSLEHQMTYRWKGMKEALAEYGVTFVGDDKNADSTKWEVQYSNDSILKDKVIVMANDQSNMPKLMADCSTALSKKPAVILSTCMADMLLSIFAGQKAVLGEVRFGTVDSFADGYAKWYNADSKSQIAAFQVEHDPYIVGKFQAINNPIITLVAKAFAGTPIRDNGKAVSINQKYWVAKTDEEFTKANKASKEFKLSKADLDKIQTAEQLQKLYNDATLENASK